MSKSTQTSIRQVASDIYNDVDSTIGRLDAQIVRDMLDLTSDYLSRFTWASKDIYVALFKRKLYKELRSQLGEADCYHYIEAIDIVIEEQEQHTSRSYNVRSFSTCMLTNETSTWEFMQRLDFIQELKQYKKQYMRATKRNSESV